MPITEKDIYAHAIETMRHASDFRAKIISGWMSMYTAFAAIYVWVKANHETFTTIVIVLAGVMTIMMWLADFRNRRTLECAKSIGMDIENDQVADIPKNRHFFNKVEDVRITHSRIIDIFAMLSILMLIVASIIF